MRKNLKYLTLLFLVMFAFSNVYAEDSSELEEESQNVTVGDVAVGTYDFQVSWENMVLDWGLDNLGKLSWHVHGTCKKEEYNEAYGGEYYSDSTCSTVIEDAGEGESIADLYVIDNDNSKITVNDKSVGMPELGVSVTWTPEVKYEYTTATYLHFSRSECTIIYNEPTLTTGEYAYYYDNPACYGEIIGYQFSDVEELLESDTIYAVIGNDATDEGPTLDMTYECVEGNSEDDPSYCVNKEYSTRIYFSVDNTKTFNTPVSGEKIGTLTVSFSTGD